jgi:hypothetical protein
MSQPFKCEICGAAPAAKVGGCVAWPIAFVLVALIAWLASHEFFTAYCTDAGGVVRKTWGADECVPPNENDLERFIR